MTPPDRYTPFFCPQIRAPDLGTSEKTPLFANTPPRKKSILALFATRDLTSVRDDTFFSTLKKGLFLHVRKNRARENSGAEGTPTFQVFPGFLPFRSYFYPFFPGKSGRPRAPDFLENPGKKSEKKKKKIDFFLIRPLFR